jgi:hypothetical protein
LGEVADDTEDESKERVDKLGDRTNEVCDGAAMIKEAPRYGFSPERRRSSYVGRLLG